MKQYNFDKVVNRKGTNCEKWDEPFVTEGVLPMWVADMDFEAAPAITRNLKKVMECNVYGYQMLSPEYFKAVAGWMKRRHGYDVKEEEICYVPNVVMGLCFAIETVTEPGDEIIIQTPVYGPFYRVVNECNRKLVESKLKSENGYYSMDFEEFENKISPKTKAVIICNPHNPCGRVWTEEELKQLADICVKHDLYIISDDIHSDLIAKDYNHTFISSLSEEIKDRCIVATSPSKPFNLASIHVANFIVHNKKLREKFQTCVKKAHAAECNAFAEAALLGAYNESEEWLDELNEYVEGNIDYFVGQIQAHLPELSVRKPEGTYLVWVDCRGLVTDTENVRDYILEKCKLALEEGEFFGQEGVGFVRVNMACPRLYVEEAVKRMRNGLK